MLKRAKMLFDNKIWNNITNILFPAILVLFALMHIQEGLTVTDTGYNYGNFVFMQSLDDMWKFSTYLANVVGALFTKLPFGQTMLGLNFYTGMVKAAAALLAYYLCVNVCKMSKETVFLGEMIALGFCWCPTALLYNYMTYLLFSFGALLIFCAFKTEKNRYFVMAGVCLGLNLMVRIPNLAEIALIVCVWFGGIIYHQKFKKIVQNTLFCMLGYFISVGTILLYISLRYGIDAYVDGIIALFEMTENATSYSAMAMILGSLSMYLTYKKWFACLLFIMFCGIIVFCILKGKLLLLKKIGVSLVVAAYVVLAYIRKQYTLDYRNYSSMIFWGIMFLMVALLVCICTMLFAKGKSEMKLLACLSVVIILITPIGSNNGLYSPVNNLFLVAPVVLYVIEQLLYEEKRVMIKNKLEISLFPIQAVLVGFVFAVFVQSVLFGSCFVFRDGTDGAKRDCKVENNDVLAGMRTTKQNAVNLQGLNDYLAENELIGEEVLLYGNVPSVSFYFGMKQVISTTWPDLDSFSYEKFEAEMDSIIKNDLPMVITDTATRDNLLAYAEQEQISSNWEKKMKKLHSFLIGNNYVESYSNDGFVVYESIQ